MPKVEFTAEENKPNVLIDGCKAKRAESKTVFEVAILSFFSNCQNSAVFFLQMMYNSP